MLPNIIKIITGNTVNHTTYKTVFALLPPYMTERSEAFLFSSLCFQKIVSMHC